MAKRIRSAIKKHRQSLKRKARNLNYKSKLKTLSKAIADAIGNRDLARSQEMLKTVISAFSKAATKGVIHRRTASRNVSRFSKKVHNLSNELAQSSNEDHI